MSYSRLIQNPPPPRKTQAQLELGLYTNNDLYQQTIGKTQPKLG